jgi:hypothetical protein
MEAQAGLEVVKFPSEKVVEQPKPQYSCPNCPKVFEAPGALAMHVTWKHPSAPTLSFSSTIKEPPRVGAKLTMKEDGIGLTLSINGKTRDQIIREAKEMDEAEVMRKAADARRKVESERRRHLEQTFRESDEKEHRRGSQQRHQYTVKHKLRAIEVLDKINMDPTIKNKGEAFSASRSGAARRTAPRSSGCGRRSVARSTRPRRRRMPAACCASTRTPAGRGDTLSWRRICTGA